MNVVLYCLDRTSLLFLFAMIMQILPFRLDKIRSCVTIAVSYALISAVDVLARMPQSDRIVEQIILLAEIILVQGTVIFLGKYRNFSVLFIGISAADFVMVGDIAASLIMAQGLPVLCAFGVQIILDSIVLFICYRWLGPVLKESSASSDVQWGILCIICALFYLIVLILSDRGIIAAEEMPASYGITTMIVVLLLILIYFQLIRYIELQRRQKLLAESNLFLNTYASGMKHESKALQEAELRVSVMRHDMRHFVRLAGTFIDEGYPQKARELMSHLDEKLDQSQSMQLCSNITINAILTEYYQLAKERDIDFRLKADVPRELNEINEYELAAVLANLMENAFNAVELDDSKAGYVKCRIYRVKEMLILAIDNSCSPDEIFTPQRTQLRNKDGHGYGLMSVEVFASKHDALLKYGKAGSSFHVKLAVKC